tara:strand:+ start:252 stop:635 length:384 start_codon:yes stop_codon:yes gene_type:complete
MGQRVSREERLRVSVLLRFPNINRNKSYNAIERKYIVTIDGEPGGVVDMSTVPRLLLNRVRLRSLIRVEKRYKFKFPDSVFEYRVGENFAIVNNQQGKSKRIAIDFEGANVVDIKDDQDWFNLKDIS